MLEIVIVDDEQEHIDRLTVFLKQYESEYGVKCNVTAFRSPYLFLENFNGKYDIVFLDIQMDEGLDGIATAKKLRQNNPSVALVFMTRFMQYAVDGYAFNSLDYMVKPLEYYSFAIKFTRIVRIVERSQSSLIIKAKDKIVKVEIASIKYVDVLGHYLNYHLENGILESRGTIEEQEERLSGYWFARCNRYSLVNMRWIDCVQGDDISVGKDILKISRIYKKKFLENFKEYSKGVH